MQSGRRIINEVFRCAHREIPPSGGSYIILSVDQGGRKVADVLCLGEILVDWVSTVPGAGLDSAATFTKAPGGAPANVAVGLARQEVSSAFIGRISADAFGTWLGNILKEEGVDTSCCLVNPKTNTRMAYVVTTNTGDRQLAEFTRIECADSTLSAADLRDETFSEAAVLHFGSISLMEEPSRSATVKAISMAKARGLVLSYDPNVRLGLWPSTEECKKAVLSVVKNADIVKINLDELQFLTSSKSFEAAQKFRAEHNIPVLVITLDAGGAHFVTARGSGTVPGFSVSIVEATGAGDGFVSGMLAGLLPHIKRVNNNRQAALQNLSVDVLAPILRRANAVGAMVCMSAGAIPAMPTSQEIDSFLSRMAVQASS